MTVPHMPQPLWFINVRHAHLLISTITVLPKNMTCLLWFWNIWNIFKMMSILILSNVEKIFAILLLWLLEYGSLDICGFCSRILLSFAPSQTHFKLQTKTSLKQSIFPNYFNQESRCQKEIHRLYSWLL